MIITSEDQEPEAGNEDAAGAGTDITAGEEAEVATEGDHEAENVGGEAEVVAGQEAGEGPAPGPRTGRGTRGSQRRESPRRVATERRLSRRKLLRTAVRRMGQAMSRKNQDPKAGKEKGPSPGIVKGRGQDRVRDPRGQGPKIARGAPGLVTEESRDPGPRIEEGLGPGITRARRARGTGMRGKRSRGITTRRRRATKTKKKKRPRQLTWRYPILREQGTSAILSDFSVAFYGHYTSNRLT